MNTRVQELLEGTHCRVHGMEWEACCYTEMVLELHNKMADLITTVRQEARAAAFREAIEIIGGVEETDPECNTWTTDCIRALEAATTKQPTEVKEGVEVNYE